MIHCSCWIPAPRARGDRLRGNDVEGRPRHTHVSEVVSPTEWAVSALDGSYRLELCENDATPNRRNGGWSKLMSTCENDSAAEAGAMKRSDALSRFIDAARDTLFALVEAGTPAGDATERISDALAASTGRIVPSEAEAPPACRYLDTALGRARCVASIASLAEAFSDLVPELAWRRRAGAEAHGEAFREGHANALIVGPGGLEQRNDVLVGASLVAPGVRYIDHHHPPEEIYIVMSEGEWYREGKGWYVPGAGGTVYHHPNVVHAMRAGAVPLLAVWVLWMEHAT